MEKERIKYFDNFKATLIFLVVFGHFLYDAAGGNAIFDIIAKVIYIFHMPAFAFISGYFSKGDVSRKKIFTFAFYYILMNTALMYFSLITTGTRISITTPYYSMWYIIALIIWRISVKYLGKIKGITVISVIIALLIGKFSEISNVFAISRIVAFFPFFIIGYKIKEDVINKNFIKKDILTVLLGIILLMFSILLGAIMSSKLTFNELLMYPYTSNMQIVNRIIIFGVATVFIYSFLLIMPNKKLPLFTKIGEKTLYIYLYHRILTLLIPMLYTDLNYKIQVTIFLVSSIVICILLSREFVARWSEKLVNKVYEIITLKNDKYEVILLRFTTLFILLFTLTIPNIISIKSEYIDEIAKNSESLSFENKIYDVISDEEKEEIDNSFSILFTGDLILLKDQVKRGYDEKTQKYNYDNIFEYTKKYIEEADFSIGVFEGPMASSKKGYSSSDFDDNTKLYLNFPDEFGIAVKNAGFDLVTVANNHMLDKGEEGLLRTKEVLEKIGLTSTGAYSNEEERNNVQIIEKDGVKIGVLSYTYGSNYYSEDELLKMKTIPLIVDKYSKNFNLVKKQVEEDFERLKSANPDIIVVLPHMGTQFMNQTDEFQNTWNEIFLKLGATVILGDHAHIVQPVEITKNSDGEDAIIVNCPRKFCKFVQAV